MRWHTANRRARRRRHGWKRITVVYGRPISRLGHDWEIEFVAPSTYRLRVDGKPVLVEQPRIPRGSRVVKATMHLFVRKGERP